MQTRLLLILIIALSVFATLSAHARDVNSLCPQDLESMPIQAGGRIKPLRVHAQDVMRFVTGKTSCNGLDATRAYCEQSLQQLLSIEPACHLQLKVDHRDTRALLGLSPDEGFIEPSKAAASLQSLENAYRNLAAQKKEGTSAGKDLATMISRISVYGEWTSGQNWLLPITYDNKTQWVSTADLHTIKPDLFTQADPFFTFLKRIEGVYLKENGDHHLLELRYDKLHLFGWAMLVSFVGLIIAAISKQGKHPLLFGLVGLILALESVAIGMRILISGRGPVTNMYETVMWVGIGALVFSLILSIFRKEKLYILCGLGLHILCLFMINFAHDMLDPSIKPLMPVLRNNYWLSTHVTTVTISYAAFALSWALANYCMIRKSFGTLKDEDTLYLNSLIYDAIKIGVVLIALGIILGGVWADYSWGRFWGWDPKETWALIVLMAYLAILHGRYSGWIRREQFIPLVAIAFLTVLMAWFGVNYILATGLHSYGFSEGGTIFIAALVATQLALLAIFALRNRKSLT